MERFDLSQGGIRISKRTKAPAPRPSGGSAELSMSVSGICGEPGNLYAFVRFEDGARSCEYRFPDVELKMSDGFSGEELVQLKFYVKNHITELKKMAAAIDPISAMMKG